MKALALTAGLALSSLLSAAPAKAEPSVWVNAGGLSYHLDRDKGFNEVNGGVGIEYAPTKDTSYSLGTYHNSVRYQSLYLLVNHQPYGLGNWKFGFSAGLANGYPSMNNKGLFPVALPMATYERGRFGVNLGIIPAMREVDAVFTIQLKVKIL